MVKLGIIGGYVRSRGKADVWKYYGLGRTFSRSKFEEIFFEFYFLKRRTLVFFIFLSDGGAPRRRGALGNLTPYPIPLLSTGLPVTDVLAVQTAKLPLRLSGISK